MAVGTYLIYFFIRLQGKCKMVWTHNNNYSIITSLRYICTPTDYSSIMLFLTGYYQSVAGQASCDQCPAGYSCTSTNSQICADNYVSALGTPDCTSCPDGKTHAQIVSSFLFILTLKPAFLSPL